MTNDETSRDAEGRARSRGRVARWSVAGLLLAVTAVVGCSLFRSSGGPIEPGDRPEQLFSEPAVEALDQVLAAHVDARGFVDYAGLQDARAPLDTWYDSVAYLDRSAYEAWSDARQIAFWCNVYNGLTLLLIIENYPIDPSLPNPLHPSESIRQIPDQWDGEFFTVMERPISLNTIEHEILRKDYDEPRIHMAVNCASVGCPPLRAEAFTAERLDEQLADQSRRFVADPDKFRIDRDADTVQLSSILDWFKADFPGRYKPESGFGDGGDEVRATLAFVAAHVGEEDASYLRDEDYEVDYLDYDWSLNDSR